MNRRSASSNAIQVKQEEGTRFSRLLGLAGNPRRAFAHRGIMRAAQEVAPGQTSCESFDLARILYLEQDVEDHGNPEPVQELREQVRVCDAVFVAPEYDYAIPGVLTSAPDWCLRSRHGPTPSRHKPVGIVRANPGGDGKRADGPETDTPAPSVLRDARSMPIRRSEAFQ